MSKAGGRATPGIMDPLAFRGVEKMLIREGKITPPTEFIPSIQRPPIDMPTLAGFAWRYLKDHYDQFKPTQRANGPGWSDFHVDMWRMVCSDHPLVAIAAPRNHAKSTSVTFAYGLANILFRCEEYIVIVSDTFEGQAVEHIRDFQRELRENDQLIHDFRVKKLIKDVEGDIIIKFEDGGVGRIKGLGMEGPIRGLKWRNKRPGLFIIDDAENTELVESKSRRDKSRNWIMKDLIPAGRRGKTKVRMVGTIMHHDASLARFCRADSWVHKIYKAHKSFNDFSEILWPEMWPEEALRKERQRFIEQNDSDGYSQEYLNDPISPTDAYFNSEDILPIPEEQISSSGVYYIGWDFAVSKDQRADYSVGSVWKVDDRGRKQVVEVIRGRWDGIEIIDKMWSLEETYRPRAHFVEKGVIDKAIGPFLDVYMRENERYMNIVKILRNKDKETFSKPLQAMVHRHDVLFFKGMPMWPQVDEELHRFPKAAHDDIVDSLAIVAQGLRDITNAPSAEELKEETFFRKMRPATSPYNQGANRTTGY